MALPEFSPVLQAYVPGFDGLGTTVKYSVYTGADPDDPSYGVSEQWTEQGMEVNVSFICGWLDRMTLIRGLRGQIQTTGGGTSMARKRPCVGIGLLDGYEGVKWSRMKCVGTGPFERIKTRVAKSDGEPLSYPLPGWPYSDLVVIPCTFATTTYQVDDNLEERCDASGRWYTTTVFKPAGEVVCPPSGSYRFKAKPEVKVMDTQVGFYLGRTEISVTRHFMPYSGDEQIPAIIGCINEHPVHFVNTTFPVGTLLLTGIDSKPYGDPGTGLLAWDITYTMLANTSRNGEAPIKWTQIMDPTGAYKEIEDQNGNPPYTMADLDGEIWPD